MFNIFKTKTTDYYPAIQDEPAQVDHRTNNAELLNNLISHTDRTAQSFDKAKATQSVTQASQAFEKYFQSRYLKAQDKHTQTVIHRKALLADNYDKSVSKQTSDISKAREAQARQAVAVGEPHFAD